MKSLITPLLFAALATVASSATLSGLWEFNDSSNIGKATVGNNLTVRGAAPAFSITAADDFGTAMSGVITTVVGSANSLALAHGISPNGGGNYVNEYSIVVDMFSPASSRNAWRTIYQTNSSNSNDGDLFIRNTTNTIGTGDLSYSSGTFAEDKWVRMTITVDNGSFYRAYIDGVLLKEYTVQPVDGRYSLDPTVLFFADNDGDNGTLQIGSLALYNGALTSTEVAALGTAGMAIPEPTTLFLSSLATLTLLRRRRA